MPHELSPDGAPHWTRRWATVLSIGVGALICGALGLYLFGALSGGDIAQGTTVDGVRIGGMSRSAAQQELEHAFGRAGTDPLELRFAGRSEKIAPQELGLSFDAARTVERAAQPGADPVAVFGRMLATNRQVEPVIHQDEATTHRTLERLAGEVDRQVRDGGVVLHDGRAREVLPEDGVSLDVTVSVTAVRQAFATSARSRPVDLPVRTTPPSVDAAETERAMREFARPAMSAPVVLTLGDRRATLDPAVIGRYVKLTADAHHRLQPRLDAEGLLADAAAAPVREANREATNAQLGLDGDRVTVVKDGQNGVKVTAEDLREAVVPLLTGSGNGRTGRVHAEVTKPALTRASVAALGIKQKLSSFTVRFEPVPYRTTNIGRAARLINGSYVPAGSTWSFNKTVGERTPANGFVDGIVIENGRYAKGSGGGVSAVATTVFNALFFAGVKPLEHKAHSFYIERYPEGREATVVWGSLDLRFLNDTGHGLYILAKTGKGSVTVEFLGTKKYDRVRAENGPRTNVRAPREVTGDGPLCQKQTPYEGFDVVVRRIFENDGKEVGGDSFTTRYQARNAVTCA
ncbi:VanW family protein [Streptomyces vinaceus]|uniref:VanW family protein n=1 Tax=Streptomyces vinaceus TaxID=1960 RepID=UPI003816D7BA